MSSGTITRWSRWFVLVSLGWLVIWQFSVATGRGSRQVTVILGLYGFVLHVVFGKAYALVPSYFDRTLVFPRAPGLHLFLAVLGTGAMAFVDSSRNGVAIVGRLSWTLGVLIFAGTLFWSIRDNVTGRETGTADAKAERRPIDRFANRFVPVALGYLLLGTVAPVAAIAGFDPSLIAGGPPVTHLVAAGGTALLIFAIGFRLLPRFLVVTPRFPLVAIVLFSGAVGPLLLATNFASGPFFLVGAVLEATALVGFASAYLDMFRRSARQRIGLSVITIGVTWGLVVACLGVYMASVGLDPVVADLHARVAVLGFLGFTIIGVTYQFYPPSLVPFPGGEYWATLAVGTLAAGLAIEVVALFVGFDGAIVVGRWMSTTAVVGHAGIVVLTVTARRS